MAEGSGESVRPDVIRGASLTARTRAVYAGLATVYILWAILSWGPLHAVLALVWTAAAAGGWLGPGLRVDAEGIHRPALRRGNRLVAWSQIQAVQRPSRFDRSVTVVRADGSPWELSGVSAERSADVAALGDKPLDSPRVIAAAVDHRAPATGPVTGLDERRAFDRRLDALAKDRARMADELARAHPSSVG